MTLTTSTGELRRAFNLYLERLTILDRVSTAIQANIATLQGHADYDATATAGEKSDVTANNTAAAGLTLV